MLNNMNTSVTNLTRSHIDLRSLLIDVSILAVFYAVTSVSHILAFPLYRMDPIKIFLLIALLGSNRSNAVFMAMSLPLFATLTSGHPVFPKNLAMIVELLSFTLLLTNGRLGSFGKGFQMISALFISRTIYYGCKAGLVWTGLLHTPVFSTPIQDQVMSSLMLLLLFNFMAAERPKSS